MVYLYTSAEYKTEEELDTPSSPAPTLHLIAGESTLANYKSLER